MGVRRREKEDDDDVGCTCCRCHWVDCGGGGGIFGGIGGDGGRFGDGFLEIEVRHSLPPSPLAFPPP